MKHDQRPGKEWITQEPQPPREPKLWLEAFKADPPKPKQAEK